MMSTLTKAQSELLKRMHVAPVQVYGSEWQTFYKLKTRGLSDYMRSDDGRHNYRYAVITDKGIAALAPVAGLERVG
jgi:hypothetical protein